MKLSSVATATYVALVENLAKKSKAKLIVTKSVYEIAFGVKFPLYFVSTTLENNVEKMNHISNQGTLSAVLRGEEPHDYKSLISTKAGDIVLAYKREQDTNAIYVLVLNHQSRQRPAITAGFNLETKTYISRWQL